MGIDVCIYCECDGDPTDLVLPLGFELFEAGELEQEFGMTHEVGTSCRYYGLSYERGPWPYICAVLMSLFASTNVKRVWYFGDNADIDHVCPVSHQDILTISEHYMKHGERPYRDKAYRVSMGRQ